MRHPFRLLFVACLAVLALFATSCGDDSDEGSAGTDAPATSAADRADDTDDDTRDADDESQDTAGGTSSGDAPGSPADCKLIMEAFEDMDTGAAMSGLTDGTDPTEELEAAAAGLRGIQDRVTADLRPHVEVLADVYSTLAESSDKIDWQALQSGDMSPAQIQEFSKTFEDFNSPDVAKAGEELMKFITEHCGAVTD